MRHTASRSWASTPPRRRSVVRAFSAAKGIPYPQAVTTGERRVRDRAMRSATTRRRSSSDPTACCARGMPTTSCRARSCTRTSSPPQRGESAPLTTTFQAQLDALLDPARYPFTGDATGGARDRREGGPGDRAGRRPRRTTRWTIASRDHDLIKTQAEQERCAPRRSSRSRRSRRTTPTLALLARLRGDEDAALGKLARRRRGLYGRARARAGRSGRAAAVRPTRPRSSATTRASSTIDAQIADRRAIGTRLRRARPRAGQGRRRRGRRAVVRARAAARRGESARARLDEPLRRPHGDRRGEPRQGAGRVRTRRAPRRHGLPPAIRAATGTSSRRRRATVALDVARGQGAGALARAVDRCRSPGLDRQHDQIPPGRDGRRRARRSTWPAAGCRSTGSARSAPTGSARRSAPRSSSPADGVKIVEFQVVPTAPHGGPVHVRIDASRGRPHRSQRSPPSFASRGFDAARDHRRHGALPHRSAGRLARAGLPSHHDRRPRGRRWPTTAGRRW